MLICILFIGMWFFLFMCSVPWTNADFVFTISTAIKHIYKDTRNLWYHQNGLNELCWHFSKSVVPEAIHSLIYASDYVCYTKSGFTLYEIVHFAIGLFKSLYHFIIRMMLKAFQLMAESIIFYWWVLVIDCMVWQLLYLDMLWKWN